MSPDHHVTPAAARRHRALPAGVVGLLALGMSFLLGACGPIDPLEGKYVLEPNTTGAGTGLPIARYVRSIDPDLAPQEAARLLAEVDLTVPPRATAVTVELVEHEPSPGVVNTDPVIRYTLPLADLDAAVAGGERPFEERERSGPSGCFVDLSLDIVGEDVPNCRKTGWGFHFVPAPTAGVTPTAAPTVSPYVEVAAEVDGEFAQVTVLIQAWPTDR